MNREYFFGSARWVGASERTSDTFSVLRGRFFAYEGSRATLRVLGLGFFKCYINGICVNPDTFLPLSSEYEPTSPPSDEILTGYRTYVPEFDISSLLVRGENVIAIHYGGGWYTFRDRVFGLPKTIFRISVESEGGTREYVSDENCLVGKSYVDGYYLMDSECHDYLRQSPCFSADFDDRDWERAILVEEPITDYFETDCPRDTLIKEIPVKKTWDGEGRCVYDCGENTTGYPVLEIDAEVGESVTVRFSEELLPDGTIDERHAHNQVFRVISDGEGRVVQPEFVWYGFRAFEIIGKARPTCVKVIYADVPVSSTFECDNETLNWIYKTFMHTMHCNMHTGHPSDCPHLERRGYTGDGQLTCHAVLLTMEGRAFYEKWLRDIADSQDRVSGHIQYTAPYTYCGGGPGGWGCAIVEVAYQLYRHYGDRSILEKYYGNMRRYIDYLEAHSEYGLVTSDKEGSWCLGDWCGPVILYPEKNVGTISDQQVFIPAAMVNTYFMVKTLNRLSEIAHILGRDEDIPEYAERAKYRKGVIQAAYFNAFDGNFIMNIQGANSFAVDIGLGNEKTYPNMVDYYKRVGHYDTGIFATDILTRTLFEHGDGELALSLMTNDGEQGFEHWRRSGATTFHEYWDSTRSRSHNHPMFGAVVAYIFEYLLGIGQKPGTAGYKSLVIEPRATSNFGKISGSITTPLGKVSVRYERNGDGIDFEISIPPRTEAVFKYGGREFNLSEGENTLLGL